MHASKLRAEWTGVMVCSECWEPRHPQDMIGYSRQEQAPPWTRPERAEVEIMTDWQETDLVCTVQGRLAQADYGTADCMVVGNTTGGIA